MSAWNKCDKLPPPLEKDILVKLDNGQIVIARRIVMWYCYSNALPVNAAFVEWQDISPSSVSFN